MRFRFYFLLAVFLIAFSTCALGAEAAREIPAVPEIQGVVSGNNVNLRSGPSTQSEKVSVLQNNTAVAIIEVQDLWVKVRVGDATEGWISRDFVKTKKEADTPESRAEAMISYARRYIGSRYHYGGITAKGFDCSGFTRFVYSQFGFTLPHNAAAQSQYGAVVEKSQLRQGDLVFFCTLGSKYINHVGIYIGGGQFIHASSGYGAVRISSLDEGYYLIHYRTARRLLKGSAEGNPEETSAGNS